MTLVVTGDQPPQVKEKSIACPGERVTRKLTNLLPIPSDYGIPFDPTDTATWTNRATGTCDQDFALDFLRNIPETGV